MTTIVIDQSGTGAANMKCRMTYTAGNGSITITGFEGCRTDGYTTQDTQSWVTKTVNVNIAGNLHSFTTTTISFPANSNWTSWNMKDAITQNNLNGTVNITITFSGSTTSNINNSEFSTNIDVGYTIVKPTLSNLSVQNITDTSAYASFDVTSTGNQTPYSPYIQLSTSNDFSNVIQTINERAGTFIGLDPNRTYYVRGSDANDAGRVYTNTLYITTSFYNPDAPSNLNITTVNNNTELYTSWNAGTGGSTPIVGYRLVLYLVDSEGLATSMKSVDTDSTNTNYNFGTLQSLRLEVGDTIYFTASSYSLDYNGTKHLSLAASSNSYTISSEYFIYVSENGNDFKKCKMYISLNGGNFREVTKDKLKIIGE